MPPNGVKYQASQILARRLRMGYAVSRWRTQAGEETAAFNRGPLVPIAMPFGPGPEDQSWPRELDMADCSNTSQNYQILDPETGFMDLSYSSAWQAGKLLAVSDTVFNSALMRFRSAVHNSAGSRARMELNGMLPKAKLVQSIKFSFNVSQRMSTGEAGEPERFRPMSIRQGLTNMRSSQKSVDTFANHVRRQVEVNTLAGEDPFDDFNLTGPNNNDWAIIHSWLSEKLLLGGIPPQYLLPDASFLPAESLRYFYIDDFWLDCLLDGALSVANHLDSDEELLVANADQIVDMSIDAFLADARSRSADGSIVTFPATHPKWSYVKREGELVVAAAEKRPISTEATAGLYYFRRTSQFIAAAERMLLKNASLRSEFFVCPVYNEFVLEGLRVTTFAIDRHAMHSLGTPEDVKRYATLLEGPAPVPPAHDTRP